MDLPHELIIQILLRLPVKSLIRFKCVCKSWFSLISHSHFANSHFQLVAEHTRRVLLISTSAPETRSIDLEASLNDDSVSLSLDFFPLQSDFYIEIKDSCRGFILLPHYSNIYIWNPSTGVHKQIPLSPFHSNIDVDRFSYQYGFGYDQSTDDYLVVSLFYDLTPDIEASHLEFFSFKANSWKEIEGTSGNYTPYMNAFDRRVGLFFNGAIHWCAYHNEELRDFIVVFDLMEKKLLDMPYPDDFEFEPPECDLWVFGEFLSLWAFDDDAVLIWVMKEYKVDSCWTYTLRLSLDAIIPTRSFVPKGSTKCGHIIGTDGCNGLVKYNEKGELLEHHSYSNEPRNTQVVVYTESLLSLPGGDNEQA